MLDSLEDQEFGEMTAIQSFWPSLSLVVEEHAHGDLEFIFTTKQIFDPEAINSKRASSKESRSTGAGVKTKPEISTGNFVWLFRSRISDASNTV